MANAFRAFFHLFIQFGRGGRFLTISQMNIAWLSGSDSDSVRSENRNKNKTKTKQKRKKARNTSISHSDGKYLWREKSEKNLFFHSLPGVVIHGVPSVFHLPF